MARGHRVRLVAAVLKRFERQSGAVEVLDPAAAVLASSVRSDELAWA